MYSAQIRGSPVVEAILMHPRLYTGPAAGQVADRLHGRASSRDESAVPAFSGPWYTGNAGQRLFYPPNVAGWDDDAWLDTSTLYRRWQIVDQVIGKNLRDGTREKVPSATRTHSSRGPRRSGASRHSPKATMNTLRAAAARALAAGAAAHEPSDRLTAPASVENVLRYLVAMAPEMQAA